MPTARWMLVLLASAVPAQTPELRFEVASVRPHHEAGCVGRWDFRAAHGTLSAENAPLLRIVSRAFELTDDRVLGPGWLDSQCYDIRANSSGNAPNLMPMLRTLLKERFHLVARRESEGRPVYALVIDKGGSKLRPYGEKAPALPVASDGKILFMVRHLPDLCERLGKVTGRPVIDKTGLTGDYMIALTYLPSVATGSDSSDSAFDIFSAVREQLGLRLEAQRGIVEVLKIDSIEKIPTGN